MADVFIRLDTTMIGIERLITKASTAEEAKALFTAKDVIYNQQKYAADVQPVKRGRWLNNHAIWIEQHEIEGYFVQAECSECGRWAHNCGADMRGEDSV